MNQKVKQKERKKKRKKIRVIEIEFGLTFNLGLPIAHLDSTVERQTLVAFASFAWLVHKTRVEDTAIEGIPHKLAVVEISTRYVRIACRARRFLRRCR